jgi:transcriptional regulator with XRE-family HTH domain
VLVSIQLKSMAISKLAERIEELRKHQNLTQVEFAKKIKVSRSQINRYLNHGVEPPADILRNIANVLHTSVDYLLNGKSDERAKASLKNTDILNKFKEVELLPEKEQTTILDVLSAYIRDFKARETYKIA